jgi:flagellar basal-body rod protein FlgF
MVNARDLRLGRAGTARKTSRVWENAVRSGKGRSLVENALLIGLSRQMVLEREMDVVANNVANMDTTGFKSDNSMFEQYVMPVARENRFAPADRPLDFVNDRGTWRNLGAGPIQQTGNPLDVAINGNGYLVVQTAGGDRYTRNGSLQINGQGQLVTGDGAPVIGDNGPIVFQPTDHDVMISPDGRVTVTEAGATNTESLRGQIRIVSFAAPQQLQKEGNNLYVAPAGVAATPDTNSKLIQGSIEKSNVNGVVAISRLIEISRAYAQVASLLSNASDLRKNAISELATVPS